MSVCVCRLFDPLYIFSAIRGCYLPDPRLEICPSHIHLLWSEIVPLNPNEFCHLICVFFQMRETWLSRTLWSLGSDCISGLVPLCSHSHASHLEQNTATQSPGSDKPTFTAFIEHSYTITWLWQTHTQSIHSKEHSQTITAKKNFQLY